MMKTLLTVCGCTLLLAPVLAWADAKATVDWTPFFKSWEKGCDFGKDEMALRQNLFHTNASKTKNPFNRLVLPPQYAVSAGKPVASRKQKSDGTDQVNIAYIPIQNGTYYGLPISGIEYTVGTDNGINYRIMTFEAPYATVQAKLKAVKYRAETSEELGITFQASLDKQKNKAVLICDASV